MKELSIEQKARAYDEAIKKAGERYNKGYTSTLERSTLAYVFPELKESEGERIINLLKMVVEKWQNVGYADYVMDIPKSDILAWLEKQGEHANFRNKIQIGDKVTRNKDGVLVNLSQLNRVEKQGDEVEPKFKVGDWVVCKNGSHQVFQVIERSWPNAKYLDEKGTEGFLNVETLDKQYRPWTIQDAKDGDVLLSPATPKGDKECPFIFREIDEDGIVRFHAALLHSESFKIDDGLTNVMGYANAGYHIPASKKQRDLLFQKMKEAGYEWDADNKALKKIESKTAAWTPMDEQRVENLLAIIEGHGYPEEVAWLNSLGDRVQPQYITITDEELAQAKKDAYNDVLDKIEYNNENPTFDDGWSAAIWYLKKRTAQPQTTWKPSDEQITWLYRAADDASKGSRMKQVLNNLLLDLKKLREE